MDGTQQQAAKKYELSTAEIQRRYLAALADLEGDEVELAKALHDAGSAAARGRYTLDEVIHGGKVPAAEDLEWQAALVVKLEELLERVSALTHRSYE